MGIVVPDLDDLPSFAKKLGVQGSSEELCKNRVMCPSMSLRLITSGRGNCCHFSFFFQEIKKAILSDLTKLGKEAGLKSFEQVMFKKYINNFNIVTAIILRAPE